MAVVLMSGGGRGAQRAAGGRRAMGARAHKAGGIGKQRVDSRRRYR